MIRTYTFSEPGGHPANEDAFVVRQLRSDPDCWLVCVADGQGGRAGGAAAAQLACRTVGESHQGSEPQNLSDLAGSADEAVAAAPTAGFTTLVALTADELLLQGVNGMSCGDSAVLAVCGTGELTELTANQFKNPPVGSGAAVFVPFFRELMRPWKVLTMTDGVWKYVGWQRVRELAATLSGEALIAALQAAARLPGSGQFQDDFTLVLLESAD